MGIETTKGEVLVYQTDNGEFSVDVRLENETVWLTKEQMSELFGRERSVITKHLQNIFANGELSESSTCAKFAQVRQEGSRTVTREVDYYNLDAIISVGYRVNSKQGTRFRQWATKTLTDHLIKGYTVNERRLSEKRHDLEAALELVRRTSDGYQLTSEQGRGLVDVITRYTRTFLLLQQYDEGSLSAPTGQPATYVLTPERARREIARLKADLAGRGELTSLFGAERDDGLNSLLGNLEQTVFGEPAYPTLESKAAHLLYFVIKNHPLSDGNKRVGACLFLHFLDGNSALTRHDGTPKLNDNGMAALALLVAESSPTNKETVIRLIMNMLS
jgi:hypothetical protein